MFKRNKKSARNQATIGEIRSRLAISCTSWTLRFTVILILLALCHIVSAADFISGHQYTFSSTYNENYVHQWSTSAGSYQENDKNTFTWIAPIVNTSTDVTISLSVIDKSCSCHSTNSRTITVLPLKETILDTKALSNSTNSTIIENATKIENTIDKNTTENIAGKAAAATPIDNITSVDNATSAQAKQASSQIEAYEYTYEKIGTNSENNTTSTPAKETVLPQVDATQKALAQPDTQSEINKTTTLDFGDDIKVELVPQKIHLLLNYLIINKTDEVSNGPHSAASQADTVAVQTKLGANQSNESIDKMPVAMNESGLATSQPESVLNQTAAGQTKLGANESNESIDQMPVATMNSGFATSQPDAVLNQTTLGDNQSDQSKGQTPAVEIKPELIASQSSTVSTQPNIETNQSTKSEDKTPAVEIMPLLPAVQPITSSNQTETVASQPVKSEGQTPVEETKPTIQDNQPSAVQAQQDNGASTPDTSVEQTPVVESMPAAPVSQPSADLNQTK
jgi:hypothetical protein